VTLLLHRAGQGAADRMGEAPCVVIDHLTEDELSLLRITLNRTAELGGWSIPDLKLEFQDLDLGDLSLEISGFNLPEIDAIIPSITSNAAPLILAAVSCPLSNPNNKSRAPWITNVGLAMARSRARRSPAAPTAPICRANPEGL
jgi:hypothetical protein